MTIPRSLKNMTLTINGKVVEPKSVSLELTKVLLVDGEASLAIDLQGEVNRRRAKAIADADARGDPHRPMDQLLRELREIDIARMQGRH